MENNITQGQENVVVKVRNSVNISSHTLFHFTNTFDTLLKILENGLRYSLLYEKIPNKKLAYFTYCACLCDIPLSMVGNHVSTYGHYAIGLRRRSDIVQKASPVFYVKDDVYKKRFPIKLYKENFFITRRLKPIIGKFIKGGKTYPRVRFYDEKEWRIFPNNSKDSFLEIRKYRNENDLQMILQEYQQGNTIYQFEKFDIINDLEYIILSKEAEAKDFLAFINSRYPSGKEEILPKVLYYDRIKSDL